MSDAPDALEGLYTGFHTRDEIPFDWVVQWAADGSLVRAYRASRDAVAVGWLLTLRYEMQALQVALATMVERVMDHVSLAGIRGKRLVYAHSALTSSDPMLPETFVDLLIELSESFRQTADFEWAHGPRAIRPARLAGSLRRAFPVPPTLDEVRAALPRSEPRP